MSSPALPVAPAAPAGGWSTCWSPAGPLVRHHPTASEASGSPPDLCVMSVSFAAKNSQQVAYGATAFTRIPRGPTSLAAVLVNPTTPCLLTL